MLFSRLVLLGFLYLPALGAIAEGTASLAPHQAVYDLSLASQSGSFIGAEARIAMELRTETCGVYDLDYRFVARFQKDQDITLTDQRTRSTEASSGTSFRFSTKTFVDGAPEREIEGEARQEGDTTVVAMTEPERQSFALPASRFPMQHTADLIARAKAGERILETRLFDGDDQAQKLLTTTAIIVPNDGAKNGAAEKEGAVPPGEVSPGAAPSEVAKRLAGLRSWRISESYYNSDSDPDGMPVFQTSYVLYENGVSDELKLDFGTYVFAGVLRKLDLFDHACK